MFGSKGLAPAAPPDDSTVLYRVDSNVITKVGSVGAGGVRAKYLSASVYLPVILFVVVSFFVVLLLLVAMVVLLADSTSTCKCGRLLNLKRYSLMPMTRVLLSVSTWRTKFLNPLASCLHWILWCGQGG